MQSCMNNQKHVQSHFQRLSEIGGEVVRLTWSVAIKTQSHLQFFKLVKVLQFSLLQMVGFVQVIVYISYHPYVFICILRLLRFICMLLVCIRMLPYVSVCSSYVSVCYSYVTRYVPVRYFSQDHSQLHLIMWRLDLSGMSVAFCSVLTDLKGLWHASAHVQHLDFCSGESFFEVWLLVKKSSSILNFCASIVEKIRSHWGEVHEAMFVVVSVPTNGSSVACNVVIWLSFLSIKFSSQRSTFSG